MTVNVLISLEMLLKLLKSIWFLHDEWHILVPYLTEKIYTPRYYYHCTGPT